ncbi:hypothetical protein DSM104299_01007 [Baekduia alba]|uniref:hypothetical protein n=1 Tax=Baekduia alba TaxID=2997333 RepID=UPI00233FC0ED|nr:hypothetical protein [Baekduia alba]WCB92312.1 hypothetical protein DSM104299_01002 [Baekduia alba]WCB92317.1 hypothetical protein DSM104299_01007 [Baekduia alba]
MALLTTPGRLRRLAAEYDQAAAHLRSAAEVVEHDPENPDVDNIINTIVERFPALDRAGGA